jgi:hypothetical protein
MNTAGHKKELVAAVWSHQKTPTGERSLLDWLLDQCGFCGHSSNAGEIDWNGNTQFFLSVNISRLEIQTNCNAIKERSILEPQ